jgi:NAD(P)-dependent dehydrogenase (short-subunit alcohol dehydrogenase family)
MEIFGKTAVVTGGANGIGRGIAAALADAGSNVVVADIEAANAQGVAQELRERGVRALGARVDVTDASSLEALADLAFRELGAVHLLFNNAGVGAMATVDAVSQGDWAWVIAVNLSAVYNGVRAFVPRMRAQKEPCHIVNTASEHGLGVPFPVWPYTRRPSTRWSDSPT